MLTSSVNRMPSYIRFIINWSTREGVEGLDTEEEKDMARSIVLQHGSVV
jgi:hypothetical protein